MKKNIFAIFLILNVSTVLAADVGCEKLTKKVVLGLAKANSGESMRFESLKTVSVVTDAITNKIYKYDVYVKDKESDSYEGYKVLARKFSTGECIVEEIKMFQY